MLLSDVLKDNLNAQMSESMQRGLDGTCQELLASAGFADNFESPHDFAVMIFDNEFLK